MKDIKQLILFISLFAFTACDEIPVDREGGMSVGFKDQTLTFYENAVSCSATLILSAPAPQDITVSVAVKNENNVKEGKDYLLSSKEILILKGQNTATIGLDFVDDRIVNEPRSFELTLTAGTGVLINSVAATCKITLLDDESDASVVFKEAEFSLWENASGSVFLPLLLEGNPNDDILVTVAVKEVNYAYKAIEGVHFSIANKEIRIVKGSSGQDNMSVAIIPVDDSEINVARVFVLEITKIVGATKITEKSTCVVTIRNNDLGISWGKATVSIEENPNGALLKLPIKLLGDPGGDLKIKVAVASGSVLVEGTDFTIRQKEVIIPSGQDSIEVEIIPIYNGAITADKSFQLAISEVEGHNDLAGGTCAVTIQNYDTDITFDATNYVLGTNLGSYAIPVKLSNAVHHDIKLTVKGKNIVAGDDLTIPADLLIIPAGTVNASLSVSVLPGNAGNSYEIKTTPVAGVTANHNLAVCALKVKTVASISRTNWSIDSYSSQEVSGEGAGNGTAAVAIDGIETTFWHTQWVGTTYNLPQYIVVDMKQEMGLASIEVLRRTTTSGSDTKTAEILVSKDKGVWTKIGTLSWPTAANGNHRQTLSITSLVTGRYIKINVTESHRAQNAQVAEVVAQGFSLD